MINSVGNKGPDEPLRPELSEEAAAAKKAASVQGSKEDKESSLDKRDRVELSAMAKDIQSIRDNVANQDAARAAHVDALRKKVENGSYQVNTMMLAQKMYTIGIAQGKE
ncbi:MAG: flagellar biosynthesis anti-sigma factor FlgM [Elusimicrobia bacterium]|nr:flagellar biosynthesis anti-sigma factor FlgM [Elusimicrobiota bacterium]